MPANPHASVSPHCPQSPALPLPALPPRESPDAAPHYGVSLCILSKMLETTASTAGSAFAIPETTASRCAAIGSSALFAPA